MQNKVYICPSYYSLQAGQIVRTLEETFSTEIQDKSIKFNLKFLLMAGYSKKDHQYLVFMKGRSFTSGSGSCPVILLMWLGSLYWISSSIVENNSESASLLNFQIQSIVIFNFQVVGDDQGSICYLLSNYFVV